MDFKRPFLIFSLLGLLVSCDTTGGLFDHVDEDEPIRTVVVSQWSEEDQRSFFEKLELEAKFKEYSPFGGDSEKQKGLVEEPLPMEGLQGKAPASGKALKEPKAEAVIQVEPPKPPKGSQVKEEAPKGPIQPPTENFTVAEEGRKQVTSLPKDAKMQGESASEAAQAPTYSVQVGVFRKLDNATTLIEKLKQRGYEASRKPVKEFSGKESHSVRIGDFKNHKEAEALAHKYSDGEGRRSVILKDIYIYKVITPRKGAVAQDFFSKWSGPIQPKAYRSKAADRPYSFRVGGLFDENKAQLLVAELKQRGYEPTLEKMQDIHGQDWWYSVWIGWYYTKEEASTAAIKFSERELMPTTRP